MLDLKRIKCLVGLAGAVQASWISSRKAGISLYRTGKENQKDNRRSSQLLLLVQTLRDASCRLSHFNIPTSHSISLFSLSPHFILRIYSIAQHLSRLYILLSQHALRSHLARAPPTRTRYCHLPKLVPVPRQRRLVPDRSSARSSRRRRFRVPSLARRRSQRGQGNGRWTTVHQYGLRIHDCDSSRVHHPRSYSRVGSPLTTTKRTSPWRRQWTKRPLEPTS